MNRPSAIEFRRTVLTLFASMAGGALAGAIAGWTVTSIPPEQTAVVTPPSQSATSTPVAPSVSDVMIIPVDRRPPTLALPGPFTEHRASSVAGLYRRMASGGLLTDDRLLGQAVAVTSDGWFVVPATVWAGMRPADAIVWLGGRSATATRAISDHASGVVFLKTPLTDLSVTAFARAADVAPGLATWVERRSNGFELTAVTALSQTLQGLDGVSDGSTARRGSVGGITAAGDRGAPVWSANGALVGLISSPSGEGLQFIPSSAFAASLASLLSSGGEIRHASLGTRTVDLAWIRADATLRLPSDRGAWVREDAKGKKPAVERASPAALAGLRSGDVIKQVDRDILDGSQDLGELLSNYRPGSKVALTVLRAGQTVEIPVELGSVVTSEELK